MAIQSARGKLIAVIGDEDTCVGFLLGGIGEINKNRQPNFMVVDKNTSVGEIEECFKRFLRRDDIDIILINQNIAELIRHVIDVHNSPIPAVLEIPSKDHPYDANKDSILRRAKDHDVIDIQCPKLLDWLMSRRLCTKTWHEQALAIREKINAAIQDMPEHKGITQLLSGTYINYFHCLQIIDILKETEADSKNIFGRYGSQRMKDWQEIVRLYEKDNIYLAEAAQILIRNVTYDIPGIKRQMAKCEQIQLECERKEADCLKNASDLRDKYYASCKLIGIEGKNVKRELVNLLQDLPELYTNVAKQAKILAEPRQFYQQFITYILEKPSVDDDSCLPLVKYIMERGNTTTYEWRYGEPPLKIEEPLINLQIEDNTPAAQDDQVDFGDGIDFGGTDSGIDFGEVALETGDIDWGAIGSAAEADLNAGGEIDFGDQVETSGIVVEETGIEGGVAREAEALTLLDAVQTRNLFTDELLELEAFLMQRIQESMSQGQNFSLTQLPSTLQLSTDQLKSMLADVRSILRLLNDVKLQHLALIRASPRYVDRLALSLQQKLQLADKMEASREKTEHRRKDASAEQTVLQPKLQILLTKSKELREQLEIDIAKRYKNRSVSILGTGV